MKGYKQGTRKITKNCIQCGSSFTRYLSRKAVYCSKKCVKFSGVFSHRTKHTLESLRKMSENRKGKGGVLGHPYYGGGKGWFKKGMRPWNYQGGIRTPSQILKDDVRWKKWRLAVFQRENWTCQWCGARSGNGKKIILHPHHIKSKAVYPDLAYEVSNGMTLCVPCHEKTDNYGGKALRKK